VADSCEHGKEALRSTNGREYLDPLSDYKCLNEECPPCSRILLVQVLLVITYLVYVMYIEVWNTKGITHVFQSPSSETKRENNNFHYQNIHLANM
jgi:hypothetical protein